jgi:hypothetical protein
MNRFDIKSISPPSCAEVAGPARYLSPGALNKKVATTAQAKHRTDRTIASQLVPAFLFFLRALNLI